MSGNPRNDLFDKQPAPEKSDVLIVHSQTVSCANDHPKVFYKVKNNEAVCYYCSRRFLYVNRA